MSDLKRNAFMLLATTLTVGEMVFSVLVPDGPDHPVRYAALPLAAAALLFAFLPIFTLKKHGEVETGRSYMHTTVVVDCGLFSVVRHPQYLGYMFLNATFALAAQHWLVAALGGGAVVFLYLQAVSEERLMIEKFGQEYRNYRRRVPRFNVVAGAWRANRRT